MGAVVVNLHLTYCVFISVVEWHKNKFRIKTKKQKYKMNIELNQKPQLNKHAVSNSCGSLKIIHFLFFYYVFYTLLCRIVLKYRNYDKRRINEFIS